MKNILMLGDSIYPDTMGGSHRHIYDISQQLVNMGYHVTAYSPNSNKLKPKEEIVNGIRIVRYNRSRNKILSIIDFIFGPYKLFKQDLKKGINYDVVHGHWPLTVLLIFLYIKLKKNSTKCIYTFHGPVVEEYAIELKVNPLMKTLFLKTIGFIERNVLSLSERITTASYYMKEKEISLYGNENKIEVNYLSIDITKFKIIENISAVIKENIKWSPDKKYIFTLRRLKKRMGIQLLIQAFSLLVSKHSNYILLIGGKGDYKPELVELVKKLRIDNNVKFLGFIPEEDVPAYYSLADVCVVPSLDLEGFGLTTAESMACGTPVVATNICANTEILNGITPQFLSDINVESLAKCIEKAIDAKKEIKYDLRNYIENNFSLKKTTNGYLNIYQG